MTEPRNDAAPTARAQVEADQVGPESIASGGDASALDQPVLLLPHKKTPGLHQATRQGGEVTGTTKPDKNGKVKEVKPLSPTPLGDVFSKEHPTDAHYTMYWAYDEQGRPRPRCPRVNKAGLPSLRQVGYDVKFWGLVLDFDLPDHAEWTPEELAKLEEQVLPEIVRVLKPWRWHTTNHGYRLVWLYKEPVDVLAHEAKLRAMVASLAALGIEADASATDWTRLMRAPRVVRDDKKTWEQPWFRDEVWSVEPLDTPLVSARLVEVTGTLPESLPRTSEGTCLVRVIDRGVGGWKKKKRVGAA